jgi:hypothetical protein
VEHVCGSVGVGDAAVDTGFISDVDPQLIDTGFTLDVDLSFIEPKFMPKYEVTFGDERTGFTTSVGRTCSRDARLSGLESSTSGCS